MGLGQWTDVSGSLNHAVRSLFHGYASFPGVESSDFLSAEFKPGH